MSGTAEPAPPPGPTPADWVRACRPKQWLKNAFVLAPVVFSERVGDPAAATAAALAALWFCPLSSALYLVNDVADRSSDARHPRKRLRPIAAGRISPRAALAAAVVLAGAAAAAAALTLPAGVPLLMGAYAANTLIYIAVLRHRVIADVLVIAVGFVMRLLAGCAAVGVEPSSWLVVCGFSLALLLGFGKRRLEVAAEGVTRDFRPALLSYSPAKLDTLLAVTTAVCLLSYMLYTVAPETIARHGTGRLVYTVPVVAYGLFRYLFKVQEGAGDGPTDVLAADPVFALTGAAWLLSVIVVFAWK